MNQRLTFDSGRYVVRHEINRGQYSTIYEAYDADADERVALKVLSVTGTHRNIAESMFRKEVGALEGLTHPAIVRLIRHVADPEREALVIVLELVNGGKNLHSLIAQMGEHQPLSLLWKTEQLLSLLRGLDLAHQRGVVHRDLKLANILVTQNMDLKISDFGVARVFQNYARNSESLTLRDFFTRPYAAPEQVLRREASAASDVHAFAIVTASLLALRLPEDECGPSELRTMLKALDETTVDKSIRADLENVLVAALDDQPSRRPRSAEFERILEELIADAKPEAIVFVSFADSAKRTGREHGFNDAHAILDDLNDNLRVSYDEGDDRRETTIICYGRNIAVRFAFKREAPNCLLAVAAWRLAPTLLARQRRDAVAVPAKLALGDGPADDLIQAAFEKFQDLKREAETSSNAREMFAVGKFILDQKRKRIAHLRLTCRIERARVRTRRGGRRALSRDAIGLTRFRVEQVRPWERGPASSDELELTWATELDDEATFSLKGRQVARFRSFEPASRILTVHLDEPVSLSDVVEFELLDIGLLTALNRQDAALRALEGGHTRIPTLREMLVDPSTIRVDRVDIPSLCQAHLEPPDKVRSLVERMLGADPIFLLQGPPGTGKTSIIAEMTAQILCRSPSARLLLVSQAHEAVDNAVSLIEKVAADQSAAWRIVRENGAQSRKPGRLGFEQSFRTWTDRVRERSRAAFARTRAAMSVEQADTVDRILTRWRERMDQAQDTREDFASSVQVIATTCLRTPAVLRLLRDQEFDWVIVDEAAKATSLEVLVPMVTGKRVILVGDHRQLPPFIDDDAVADLKTAGHDPDRARTSLFEELYRKIPATNRDSLRVQFRMHRSIGAFVGNLYYADIGGLDTGVPDHERQIDVSAFDRESRIFWCDVDGNPTRDGTSWWNGAEIGAVGDLIAQLGCQDRIVPYKVAVIAPYRAQVDRLQNRHFSAPGLHVKVATVDAFQGREVDIVLYSLVRDLPGGARFVVDPRRLNVAFSRGKLLLVIIGNRTAARGSSGLKDVVAKIPTGNATRSRRFS